MERAIDNNTYYVILDEIQKVKDFESVLNSFLRMTTEHVDYTGSTREPSLEFR